MCRFETFGFMQTSCQVSSQVVHGTCSRRNKEKEPADPTGGVLKRTANRWSLIPSSRVHVRDCACMCLYHTLISHTMDNEKIVTESKLFMVDNDNDTD